VGLLIGNIIAAGVCKGANVTPSPPGDGEVLSNEEDEMLTTNEDEVLLTINEI
jgi:hypothetical protein